MREKELGGRERGRDGGRRRGLHSYPLCACFLRTVKNASGWTHILVGLTACEKISKPYTLLVGRNRIPYSPR
jgi:hypothetical protein